MKVKLQEVIEALLEYRPKVCTDVAVRIQQHGVEVECTPMTDDERLAVYDGWFDGDTNCLVKGTEQAVLNRLGVAPTLKHKYWMAGESGCPDDIKADNGELCTMRCKVCGKDNDKNPCRGEP